MKCGLIHVSCEHHTISKNLHVVLTMQTENKKSKVGVHPS